MLFLVLFFKILLNKNPFHYKKIDINKWGFFQLFSETHAGLARQNQESSWPLNNIVFLCNTYVINSASHTNIVKMFFANLFL